jgi:hypothetical protein
MLLVGADWAPVDIWRISVHLGFCCIRSTIGWRRRRHSGHRGCRSAVIFRRDDDLPTSAGVCRWGHCRRSKSRTWSAGG